MKLLHAFAWLLALTKTSCFASVNKPNCGGKSSSKKIELINPIMPPRECVYKINAYSDHVCQLRIDFSYILAPPSLPNKNNGLTQVQCDKDYFQAGNLRLCGYESSQHIYLPFNRTAGVKSVDLVVALANRADEGKGLPIPQWTIIVTQLECLEGQAKGNKDAFILAPTGCLQYYPYSKGSVTSFNFMNGKGIYPGKLNFAICFRRADNTKALNFNFESFYLGADEHCSGFDGDSLMIPQAKISKAINRTAYFCGTSLQGEEVVSTNPGPLMLLFSSGRYNTKESGYKFNYSVVLL